MHERLVKVFQTVFPEVSEGEIPQVSQETLASWDSVAAITLVNVIEEEFSIQMDFDALADLTSFAKVEEYLRNDPGLAA